MSLPAPVRQPGPPAQARVIVVPAHGADCTLHLPAGKSLLEALAGGFAAAGYSSGIVRLDGLALGPFAYVMPALSPDGANAAFYSETFRPAGITRIESGSLTLGRREGAPFFHAHALWREADGRRSGGHILPEETVLAEPATAAAFGIAGAVFARTYDAETNFALFEPAAEMHAGGAAFPPPACDGEGSRAGGRAVALRLRPNVDIHAEIERLCAAHGIRRARILGGVGSTIGARFADGREVTNFATEIFSRDGKVAPNAVGNPVASLDIGLVDFTGAMAQGELARGRNRVLMTCELVIAED